MKSTLTVVFSSMILVAGSVSACPLMDGGKEITYLQPKQGEQSLVEHERKVEPDLLVQLADKKQETTTN